MKEKKKGGKGEGGETHFVIQHVSHRHQAIGLAIVDHQAENARDHDRTRPDELCTTQSDRNGQLSATRTVLSVRCPGLWSDRRVGM